MSRSSFASHVSPVSEPRPPGVLFEGDFPPPPVATVVCPPSCGGRVILRSSKEIGRARRKGGAPCPRCGKKLHVGDINLGDFQVAPSASLNESTKKMKRSVPDRTRHVHRAVSVAA